MSYEQAMLELAQLTNSTPLVTTLLINLGKRLDNDMQSTLADDATRITELQTQLNMLRSNFSTAINRFSTTQEAHSQKLHTVSNHVMGIENKIDELHELIEAVFSEIKHE